MHPDDLAMAEQAMHQVVSRGLAFATEWRVKLNGGAERWLMARGRPVKERRGRVERYLGIVLDITERKQAQEQLQAINKELELRVEQRTLELQKGATFTVVLPIWEESDSSVGP